MNTGARLRVAIVGGGISGISCAANLAEAGIHSTLFEASDRLGGHTDTHRIVRDRNAAVADDDGVDHVDTGFIVFNPENYPHFCAWLRKLGVGATVTDMSFAVRDDLAGLEYGTASLSALLSRKRNIANPRFHSMLRDLRRFYRTLATEEARASLPDLTVETYLRVNGYGSAFSDSHLLPMCAALWSQPRAIAGRIGIRHVVDFMANHHMLRVAGRPEWRVVTGGSSRYVDAFAASHTHPVRLACPVHSVLRDSDGVSLATEYGTERFDHVVLACHSDQALELLGNAMSAEQDVLRRMPYQHNDVYLHSDESFMPRRRRAWSSWNVIRDEHGNYTITYWMNRLQRLTSPQNYFVTLNPGTAPADVHFQGAYEHPVFSLANQDRQARLDALTADQPARTVHFAGAYWGAGFHEDGFVSGLRAAETITGAAQRPVDEQIPERRRAV